MNEDIKNLSLQELLEYKKNYGNDNIYYKEKIKKKLIHNRNIIEAINNKELDIDCPEDYIGNNIFPYYLITETQTETQNYICFETSFTEVDRYNDIMKYGQIIFYILCNSKTILDKKTGIARHDLLAALLTDEFNWSTEFGSPMKLISDKPYAVDNNYILRTLTFQQTTTNGIVEPQTQSIINKSR